MNIPAAHTTSRAAIARFALALLPLVLVVCGAPSAPVEEPSETAGASGAEQERSAEASAAEAPPRAEGIEEPAPPPASGAPETTEPERRRYVVAAVGDSLTAEATRGRWRYLAYLRERCPESVFEDFGRGGDMVNMMRRRFERDLEPRLEALTHIIVFGGVNDLYSDETAGRTPALIERDLTYMYQAARAHGLGVIALTVAPWGGGRHFTPHRGDTTRELNDWIRATPTTGMVDRVIDAYQLLSCGDPEHLCPAYMRPFRDGLHFGPGGHTVLGEALYTEVFSDCR